MIFIYRVIELRLARGDGGDIGASISISSSCPSLISFVNTSSNLR